MKTMCGALASFLFAFMLFSGHAHAAIAGWETVGAAGFSDSMVSVSILREDPLSKEKYVAYADERGGGIAKVLVKKFNGTDWEDVGGSESALGYVAAGADRSRLAFEFNSQGTPFIAYADAGDQEKMKLKKLDGGIWVDAADMTEAKSSGPFVSLAIDPNGGDLFFAYTEAPWNDWRQRIAVKKLNGASWEPFASGLGYYNTGPFVLAVEPGTGELYIAFTDMATAWEDYDNNYYAVSVMKNGVSGWGYVGERRFARYTGGLNLIPASATGGMMLAYQTTGNVFELRAFSSGMWEQVANSVPLSNETDLSRSYPIDSEIGIDQEGKIYAAYGRYDAIGTDHSCRVSKWEDGNWTEIGRYCADGIYPQQLPSVLASTDGFFLSSRDAENGYRLSVMKRIEQVTAPDLETIFVPVDLNLKNESPYAPDILGFGIQILNKSETTANNVSVEVSLNDQVVETREVGAVERGVTEYFNITLDTDLEDAVLKIEAITEGQTDGNPFNNTLEQPLDVHFVDFRHDRDAFSFKNWGYEEDGGFEEEYDSFILSKLKRNDFFYLIEGFLVSKFRGFAATGHCYGMASASMAYKIWPEEKPMEGEAYEMGLEDDAVKADIIERHWQQVTSVAAFFQIQGGAVLYDARKEYGVILDSIKNKKDPIGIILRNSDGELHAVVAYKIVDLNEVTKKVYVYDNEDPLCNENDAGEGHCKSEENSMIFDLEANEARYGGYDKAFSFDPWKFSESSKKTAEDLRSLASMGIKDLWDNGLAFFEVRSPVDPLLVDDLGRKIGFENGIFLNEIPGARMESFLGHKIFYLPRGSKYDVSLVGTDTGVVGIDVVVPDSEKDLATVVYQNVPVTEGQTIKVEWDGGDLLGTMVAEDAVGKEITPTIKEETNIDDIMIDPSSKELKERAIEKLKDARTGDKKWDKIIDKAISDMEDGLRDEYWQNEDHLQYPQGTRTFNADIKAVSGIDVHLKINNWLGGWGRNKPSEDVKSVLNSAIEDVVHADERLARIAIGDAGGSSGNEKMLRQAEKFFEKAKEAQQKHPVAAIDLYKNAWFLAEKSILLKHAE